MWSARTNGSTRTATTALALSRLLKSDKVTLVTGHAARMSTILTLKEKASSAGLEQRWSAFSSKSKYDKSCLIRVVKSTRDAHEPDKSRGGNAVTPRVAVFGLADHRTNSKE